MQSTARTSLAMAYTLMALMMMMMMMIMMMNMFAILMLFHLDIPNISLFHLDIPNISLFPSMVMDLADLMTRDGALDRFSMYIFFYTIHVLSLVIEIYD